MTIIGARPQIIKASAISRAIKTQYSTEIEEIIVHTGQHYDASMSEVFFTELEIPQPKYNLHVGSSSHGNQTADILKGVEKIAVDEKIDAMIIYGDTNSTLASAIAGSKIHIPIIHIEAGLRSFNKRMPEEINRIVSDHVSTLLFCPTKTAIKNLENEGFKATIENQKADIDTPKMYHCGDIMYDNSLYFSEKSELSSSILSRLNLVKEKFILLTIHRNSNTDEAENLTAILEAILEIENKHQLPIVLPIHPRTKKMMQELLSKSLQEKLASNSNIKVIEPLGFLDILSLEKNSRLVITDSGGLQKEAYFFKKPCVILREQTEWVEIVENGNAVLCEANAAKILNATTELLAKTDFTYPNFFGDGKAGSFIVGTILKELK